MSRWDTDDDPNDDDDEGWSDDESDDGMMDCPYCGEAMYDDSPRCPNCGRYLSAEDATEKKPAWIVITAVVLLIVMLSWLAIYF